MKVILSSAALSSDKLDGYIGNEYKRELEELLGFKVERTEVNGHAYDLIEVNILEELLQLTYIVRNKDRFGGILVSTNKKTGLWQVTFYDDRLEN